MCAFTCVWAFSFVYVMVNTLSPPSSLLVTLQTISNYTFVSADGFLMLLSFFQVQPTPRTSSGRYTRDYLNIVFV